MEININNKTIEYSLKQLSQEKLEIEINGHQYKFKLKDVSSNKIILESETSEFVLPILNFGQNSLTIQLGEEAHYIEKNTPQRKKILRVFSSTPTGNCTDPGRMDDKSIAAITLAYLARTNL